LATPETNASATISFALEVNGSAEKTATFARSEATIIDLRGQRSRSGPSRTPITIAGRNSAMSRALIQEPEWVRSKTSDLQRDRRQICPQPRAESRE